MKKKAVKYSITAKKQDFEIIKVRSSEDAFNFAKEFYHEDILIYESAFIILLNQANNVTGYAKISQGGISQTLVDKRIIAKYAIDALSSAVIFVHNHQEAINLSDEIKKGLNLFGIKLLDSIIISDDKYYSMLDEGVLV